MSFTLYLQSLFTISALLNRNVIFTNTDIDCTHAASTSIPCAEILIEIQEPRASPSSPLLATYLFGNNEECLIASQRKLLSTYARLRCPHDGAHLSKSCFFSSLVIKRWSGTSTCFVMLIRSSFSTNCNAQGQVRVSNGKIGRNSYDAEVEVKAAVVVHSALKLERSLVLLYSTPWKRTRLFP